MTDAPTLDTMIEALPAEMQVRMRERLESLDLRQQERAGRSRVGHVVPPRSRSSLRAILPTKHSDLLRRPGPGREESPQPATHWRWAQSAANSSP